MIEIDKSQAGSGHAGLVSLIALVGVIPTLTPPISLATTVSPAQPAVMPSSSGVSTVAMDLHVSATGFFTYRFPLPADTMSAQMTLTMDAEYRVQLCVDNVNWSTVLKQGTAVIDGSNPS